MRVSWAERGRRRWRRHGDDQGHVDHLRDWRGRRSIERDRNVRSIKACLAYLNARCTRRSLLLELIRSDVRRLCARRVASRRGRRHTKRSGTFRRPLSSCPIAALNDISVSLSSTATILERSDRSNLSAVKRRDRETGKSYENCFSAELSGILSLVDGYKTFNARDLFCTVQHTSHNRAPNPVFPVTSFSPPMNRCNAALFLLYIRFLLVAWVHKAD